MKATKFLSKNLQFCGMLSQSQTVGY